MKIGGAFVAYNAVVVVGDADSVVAGGEDASPDCYCYSVPYVVQPQTFSWIDLAPIQHCWKRSYNWLRCEQDIL